MRRATAACLLTLLCLAACNREAPSPAADTTSATDAAPAPWANDPSARRIEADVRTLADDAMAGRETGTQFSRPAAGNCAPLPGRD